ncbi:UxaA family hydrolase [Sediminispirochaeta bajacaliforniensis]|uniref:UxaA family hydrolase n=1 Tax=Sediminispirochaeta bajacaliforniensis TaxID=148 RepID=UPI0003713CDA|nr:UxaA family hydrolase [Sediminispirochaeta bajacaliforniensis]
MDFLGYARKDGGVGTRNDVGILSTVICANEVAERIARQVSGTTSFLHHQGCCQTPVDINRVTDVLIGLGKNPNLAAVLLVSLGCESTNVGRVAKSIAATGKPVEIVTIQEGGGAAKAVAKGILLAQAMVTAASELKRELFPICKLVLGLKCGSSDTTSGLSSNPVVGILSDLIVKAGGTSILGEVTEFIGAEHLLARHAKDQETADAIFSLVNQMENRAMQMGFDIRGGQPTGGNIKGGLTTIEEKSLGAIAKAGSAKIQAVYEYGVRPDVEGLVVMNSPGREPELLTGLAAAGATLITFTTGRGAPQGFPFVPVIKVTGNEKTWDNLKDHMDFNVSSVIDGSESLADAGNRLLDEVVRVASGKKTKAEISGYTSSMDIYMVGPVI